HGGTGPGPPGAGWAGLRLLRPPHEPRPDRTAQLKPIAHRDLLGQIRRDFAVRQPFDGYLDATLIWGGGNRIGTDRGVPIRSRQAHVDMLPREVAGPAWNGKGNSAGRGRFV